MMNEVTRERKALTSSGGEIQGYLDVYSDGRRSLLNHRSEILGFYNPAYNQTFDASGRTVAQGDLVLTLLSPRP